jgi:hypothetical protein
MIILQALGAILWILLLASIVVFAVVTAREIDSE